MFKEFISHPFFKEGIFCHMVENATVYFLLCGLFLTVVPYLLGSVNFAIIISEKRFHDDVRTHGSGNAGMTNMLRTYGKRAAALTLGGDALKAIIASLIGSFMMGMTGAYIAGFFCVLGHTFPIFFKFKGGKGVLCAATAIAMLSPLTFVWLLLIFVIIVFGTKFVSLGSVIGVMAYPLLLQKMEGVSICNILALMIAALVEYNHRENLKRLLEGKENKISIGKKDKKKADSEDEDADAD